MIVFVLKKILAAFFIPPGLFFTLLAGAAVFILIRKKPGKKLAIYLLAVGALIWGLSIAPVSDSLTRSLERAVPVPPDPQGDVIIVLYGTGQRLGPAIGLYHALKVPLVLCGFNYLQNNSADRERLLSGLEESGIPRGEVIIETQSRDTRENIREVKTICRERGFRSPLIVTSAFHGRRVRLTCRKQEFQATLVPVSFTVFGRAIRYTWRDYLPLAEDLYSASLAMNEYLGLLFYGIAY